MTRMKFKMNTEDVIFGGFDSATEVTDCEFGIYVATDHKEAAWLPAVTSSRDVVEKLKTLSLGQVFEITAEEADGPMGTRVNGVKVKPDTKVYAVPGSRPMFLTLE